MGVYKDKKRDTWYVQVRYTDWKGERLQKVKRGFPTKKAAQSWEREFLQSQQADPSMTLDSFYKLYERDVKAKLKENTWLTKKSVYEDKIRPYFGKKKLNEISASDILAWHTTLLSAKMPNGKPYSQTYLRSIHAQLSAILNHAVKFYGLRENPAKKSGGMGSKDGDEMLFWTKEEYLKFSDVMMDNPLLYYAFEVLYWCGVREGELLALTRADFDLEARTLRINKSYQRIHGKDVITTPKTKKSIRTIKIPDFLCDEMRDFFQQFYHLEDDMRLFPMTKYKLLNAMETGSKKAGVKKIRIHDLRHSHISLLIDMGFSAVAIAERVGHESVEITYRYAHLFPTVQTEMADKLNMERRAS